MNSIRVFVETRCPDGKICRNTQRGKYMETLKERIRRDGHYLQRILKLIISSTTVDASLMDAAAEFARLFRDTGATRILTARP